MFVGLGKGTPAVLLLTFLGWCFCGHSSLLACSIVFIPHHTIVAGFYGIMLAVRVSVHA